MPTVCFVPNCPIGSRQSRTEYIEKNLPNPALFGTPLDHETFQKWKKIVPSSHRRLTSVDKICELHFEKDCILRSEDFTFPNGKKIVLERKKSILKRGSVPTIFPNFTLPAEKIKSPLKTKITSPLSSKSKQISRNHEEEEQVCSPAENKTNGIISDLFDQVTSRLDKEYTCSLFSNNLVIQKWTPDFQSHYKLVVMDNSGIKGFIRGKEIVVKVDGQTYERIETVDELLIVLRHITSIPACQFSPEQKCGVFVRRDETLCDYCQRMLEDH